MMKKLLLGMVLSLFFSAAAFATCTNPLPILNGSSGSVNMSVSNNTADSGCMYNVIPMVGGAPNSLTNPFYFLPGTGASFAVTGTFWQTTQPVSGTFWQTTQPVSAASLPLPTGASTSANQAGPNTASVTNPTSTLTMTSATTAYTVGQLIASSATAGSVVVPSFAIANSGGAAKLQRIRLTTTDPLSTAWFGQTIQVDLWSAAPTFTAGDRGAFEIATGSAGHLAAFTCVISPYPGATTDGAYSECYVSVGTYAGIKLASGTSVFWTLQAVTGSGLTTASKVFTLTAEVEN